MCGVCGEIRFDGLADTAAVQAMASKLQDRGPDAGGVFGQGRVAFGHRRLKILDLSEASQQPMLDAELGLAIVFNGCIYNFRSLRAELEAKGYRFFSTGDTEVILKAYHAWGARCVERFYGMFAFAIWERDSGRVVLARDRLGIKPLYLSETKGRLRFASTLPALLAAGDVDTTIDPIALHHYMSYHAVVPAPMTIIKGVRKLPPATILTLEPDGSRTETVYWDLQVGPRAEDRNLTEGDWRALVLDTLSMAVDRRRVADVPTGVLLSGGLDSSLLVALLARQGQTGLKTFSVGFDAVNGIEGDEFKYSDIIAREFETEHMKIAVDASRTLAALPATIAAMAEPQMSHDAVGFYLLSQEVSQHVKVVQSGQGADEIFAGYHWYPKMLGSTDPAGDYARVYFDRDHAEMREALAPGLIDRDVSRAFVEGFFSRLDGAGPVDKTLQLDTQVMLVDDPVKRVDNMTMAFGLEARVPFLDHDLVELAARIPAALKLRDGGKSILKEAARAVLPARVIDRPKGYFPVPALKHIRGPYLDFVRGVLEAPAARERGLFNRAYIDRLLADPDGTLTPKGHSKLWQVSLLECWLQTHGI
ncbi:N-acetylglutaminylglutamine amidotransferase [Methylobacterium soli]|uniref:asparagine synthase (glutamine-hydrolyzing) n=1 Tax=Methylobacterium soli TaxID=553447 RepID=A0A6L3SW02_9HYPH|nr:N-acetylglutaminylglutamine amidotransferase [Methylobacterium soli]KAB1075959.1 N-acetylglutaminylglutamine amidotransferase [Methylobacterium soli]GJE45972.1 Asparagine synthetase [glutamine-hydrolyzing] 1 [Methylobacterium soli]